MTANLKGVVDPDKVITRNIRFLYPVNVPLEQTLAPTEYEVDAIIGERYGSKSAGENNIC